MSMVDGLKHMRENYKSSVSLCILFFKLWIGKSDVKQSKLKLKLIFHCSPTIDYFSLDIEGAEYVVLETLPWSKVNITLLSIETNHAGDIFPGTREDIKTFLEDRGYNLSQTTVIDDFFLHKDFKMSKEKRNHNKDEL